MPVFQLHPEIKTFPNPSLAEPDLPLAIGGDLTTERLLNAYRSGIFPWYSEGEPLMWWSPDPRMVLFPEEIKIQKSMKQVLRNKGFKITVNQRFEEVIEKCSEVERPGQEGTWITSEMIHAYMELHKLAQAHSIEVWQGEVLVGGLYGVVVNGVFSGESMYANISNASKVALIALCQILEKAAYKVIDCQVYTSHLEFMGARKISRDHYLSILKETRNVKNGIWGNLSEFEAKELVT